MTAQELIKTLADDCEMTRARAEDFLTAFCDLVTRRLQQGDNALIGRLGILSPTKAAGKTKVCFNASVDLRDKLGLGPKIKIGPLCVNACGRKRAPRHTKCHGCIAKEYRRRKKKK